MHPDSTLDIAAVEAFKEKENVNLFILSTKITTKMIFLFIYSILQIVAKNILILNLAMSKTIELKKTKVEP